MSWNPRKHKYGAKKVVTEDGTFDSKREAKDWGDLKIRQMAGEIVGLVNQHQNKDQCTFLLHGRDGSTVCKYIVDFVYQENGRMVAHDSKGMSTPVYSLKRKLFIAEYGAQWIHRET